MTGSELRNKFLQFFASKSHLILPSYPLIPQDDPTLLLIGAGMAPFKPFFTGKMKPPHPRIVTCQKCIRTGDIENVGRTARHHTFFEMLGNFSFGDYFKKEAIAWAWEFITKELELPKEKLWITIHTSDDEAYEIWRNDIGLPADRIVRMEDNFWEIGPGPCGPCSEIYVDLGEERGCGQADCGVGCNCDRYLEIWNLVFTQFDRDEAGNYTPLAKKNIDTGAGLERIASVLQNKKSNFETDLLYPIIEYAAQLASVAYGKSDKTDVSLKVIADHARSMTVMIGDGVLPSNEGRGYVLRRILRRAVRHGRLMGIEKPFMAGIVDVVVNIFADSYSDLADKRDYIKKVVQLEEERFHSTLVQGMELLNKHIQVLEQNNEQVLEGNTAFRLYDTFGFPWELTQEILAEHGMKLDKAAFDAAMSEQRERARTARQENEEQFVIPDLSGLVTEGFNYNPMTENTKVAIIFKSGQVIDAVSCGEDVAVILESTPFYAESGGQIGDSGTISGQSGRIQVTMTRKLPDGTIYHLGRVEDGCIKVGDAVRAEIDGQKRCDAARNHSATHLLQAALRKVLGSHVNQAGSFVGPDRLRFDFSHFAQVSPQQLEQVETIVNDVILENINVGSIHTTQEMAKAMGATALFGEKYGEKVCVVVMGEFSKELCGGTHVGSTAEIGLFKIVSETGIGAGLRRIEAVTGKGALHFIKAREDLLKEAAAALKTRPEEVPARIEGLSGHIKELEQELAALNAKLAKSVVQELVANARQSGDIQIVAGQVAANDMDDLRSIADMVRDQLSKGVVVLGAINQGKVNFVVMASKEAVANGIHAGNIVKEVAKVAGGGGGGRPEMAQAGGKNPEKIGDALAAAYAIINRQIEK